MFNAYSNLLILFIKVVVDQKIVNKKKNWCFILFKNYSF
jgi:hypothetical protein